MTVPVANSESSLIPMHSTVLRTCLAAAVFVAVVGALAWRLQTKLVDRDDPRGSEAVGRNGGTDFRDVIYFPTRAAVEGVNPYDSDRTTTLPDGSPKYWNRYPVLNLFPLYSPLVLALFGVFAAPEFYTAVTLWAVFNLALLGVWSYALWRAAGRRPSAEAVLYLASAVLLSQSGRSTFLGGETSLVLALTTLAASYWSPSRPYLSATGLALASLKPTVGLPLGLLLLARRDVRSAIGGWGIGFVLAVAGLIVIFVRSNDWERLPQIVLQNQRDVESDQDVDAQRSSVRLDAAGAMERWTGATGPLARLACFAFVASFPLAAVYRLSYFPEEREAKVLSNSTILIATAAVMYHLLYDGLMLWGAIVLIAFTPENVFRQIPRWGRRSLVGCLLLTQVNVLTTPTLRQALARLGFTGDDLPPTIVHLGWTFACTLNGFALLASLLLSAWFALRWNRAPNQHVGSHIGVSAADALR